MTIAEKVCIIVTYLNETRRVETNSTLYVCMEGDASLANIEEKVFELIKPYIEELEYNLYDVEYVKER